MMMAKMQKGPNKHFCHEDDTDYFRNSCNEFLDQQSMIVDFTSEPENMSGATGLFFEQNPPKHLCGLKDFELEFLLTSRNKRKALNRRCKE